MENSIGEKIRHIRETLGWRQTEFARLAGIDDATLSVIENGRSDPGYETLQKIINTFKVNPSVLHTQLIKKENVKKGKE